MPKLPGSGVGFPPENSKRGLNFGKIQNGHCKNLGPNFIQHHSWLK